MSSSIYAASIFVICKHGYGGFKTPRDLRKVLRGRRALACILNTFPLSHRWKSVDNMTDFEPRLTQKMERNMTQCEHELLCGLEWQL